MSWLVTFQDRSDRESVKEKFTAAFAKVETPSAKAALANVASLAGLAKERFAFVVSGRSDVIARMAVARMTAAR